MKLPRGGGGIARGASVCGIQVPVLCVYIGWMYLVNLVWSAYRCRHSYFAILLIAQDGKNVSEGISQEQIFLR